jgi:putative hydrolase
VVTHRTDEQSGPSRGVVGNGRQHLVDAQRLLADGSEPDPVARRRVVSHAQRCAHRERTRSRFHLRGYRGLVTQPPFGFSAGDGDDDDNRPADPLAAFGGAAGQNLDLGAMLRQLGDLMSGETGPVNWQVARQAALQAIGTDAGTTAADTRDVTDAVRLADLWLDPVTTLPSGVTAVEAWSRRRWLEATRPAWTELVEPVAARVGGAMGQALPEEMRSVAAPLMGVMSQVGGLMFGGQIGQALGSLAGEVVSSTDIGLQLGANGLAALLPENVADFGRGLDVPADQVRLFVALREAAHHRLFGHVPWLRGHLVAAVTAYAEGITIDTSRFEQLATQFDPSDPEAMQRAIGEGFFAPDTTPAQQAALARLETLLALIEGWVDTVSAGAAGGQLPSFEALRETMRRRRATGGPAERTFASLVGLELRPRRLREAALLWQSLASRQGVEGRDGLWAHPDLLPGPDDLADPQAWLDRDTSTEFDIAELDADTPDTGTVAPDNTGAAAPENTGAVAADNTEQSDEPDRPDGENPAG